MYEIARRTLTLCTEPMGEVTVTIGLPYEEPTGEWSCPYRVDGLAGWEHERKVTGVDSLAAVELAVATVRAALTGSHEAKEGLLSWDDEPVGRRPQIVYVNWDKDHDIAYIAMKHEIVPGDAVRQTVAEEVVLDFASSGELLGMELVNAATLLPSEMRI
ncbi:DUF2283 domain-containing protein [Nonomuraea sp. LPB2021202275-12-8]|uniref:DUF2283 domain-containing protein n=1 Tax=Nonomuraea sp. LPB2021202275-12-8 TaxID=3120159 RepID=UPI00300D5DA4